MSPARALVRLNLIGCLTVLSVGSVRAQDTQVTANSQTGIAPYNTYAGDHENINLATSDLNIQIPLVTLPGRNHHDLQVTLSYDSRVWTLAAQVDPFYGFEGYYWTGGGSGWHLNYPLFVSRTQRCDQISDSIYNVYWTNFTVQLPGGDSHTFFNTKGNTYHQNACDGPTTGGGQADITSDQTTDGSFLQFITSDPNNAVLQFKDGSSMIFYGYMSGPVTQIDWKDSNGNTITFSQCSGFGCTITDSLGRVVTSTSSGLTYRDSTGIQRTIAFGYSNFTIAPTFSQPPPSSMIRQPGSGTSSMLSSVTLPDSLSYTMQYNNFAELTKITYPAGGYTRYAYGAVQGLYQLYQDSGSGDVRVVTNSYACPNSSGSCSQEFVTTYSATRTSGNGNNTAMTVTDPVGNYTMYTFTDSAGPDFVTLPQGTPAAFPRELTRKIYNSSGVLMRSIQTDWYTYTDGGGVTHYELPIRKTTTLDDGKVAKTEWDYDTSAGMLINVLEERIFDYSSLTVPIIKHDFAYLKVNPVNSVDYPNTLFILDRKASEQTYDSHTGSNVLVAQTTYEYDSYTAGLSASGAVKHDSAFSTSYTTRGNVTATNQWRNTDGTWLTTRNQYDDAGNVLSSTDPLSHTTSFSYADVWGNTICAPSGGNGAAYVTRITDALGHATNNTYNSCSGNLASAADPNNLTTTHSYEMLNRRIQSNFPDAGQATSCFSEVSGSTCYSSSLPLTVTQTQKINASLTKTSMTVLDGLGRTIQTQLTSDPQGTVFTDTTYDALGRVSTVSNPYRSGGDPTTSSGTTTYGYDALGRKTSQTYADGSVLTTTYCGASTLVTDPVGKWRRSRSDTLGHLVEVDEPNAIGATVNSNGCPGQGDPIWVTSYAYDALGNLTSVLQNGSHARSFTYDSLSHLLTSNNPEAGTITYTYDAAGNVATKTDARSITTTYGYDAVNRQTSRSYSNNDPRITTTYDESNCLGLSSCQNIGHATSMADAAGSESWAYQTDSANLRSVHANQRTTFVTKTSNYYFDLSGNLTSITYPTGRVVNYTYDAANRPQTAADASSGITYAAAQSSPPTGCLSGGFCYTPQGTEYSGAIGLTSSFSGVSLSETYNNRLQPLRVSASSPAGNAFNLMYSFVDPATSKNAGHLNSITNNLDNTRSQSFTYDQLNRITGALTASTYSTSPSNCWGQSYALDAWGNLNSIAATTNPAYVGCSQESGFSTTSDANNHLPAWGYDASGNATSDGTYTYTYDAESQIKTAAGVAYSYDGSGRRVSKSLGKLYWYGSGGEILAETDLFGNTLNEYVFFGGKRIAEVPANGVSNPGFEQDLQSWSEEGGVSPQIVSTNRHSGTFSLQFSTSTYGGSESMFNSQWIPVTPGYQVQFGGWVYLQSGSAGSVLANWQLQSVDANYNSLGSAFASPEYPLGAFWQLQTGTYTVPANGAYVRLTILFVTTSSGQTVVQMDDGFIRPMPQYYVEDLLGSSRVVTEGNGSVCYDGDFYPYGGERVYTSDCSTANNYKFEGKERDETGNDNFGARYYSSPFGRWLSADWSSVPVAVPYANLTNPQTLNLYAMVDDDPETSADLDGHASPQMWAPCGGTESGLACQRQPYQEDILRLGMSIGQPWAGAPQQAGAAAGTVSTGTAAEAGVGAGVAEVLGPATVTIASAWLLITNVTDVLVENAQGKEQLDAIISVVAVTNAHLLAMAAEHTQGKRESSREKHEKGKARKARDRGGEKGDARRAPPRKRPDGWKAPWPPKPKPEIHWYDDIT